MTVIAWDGKTLAADRRSTGAYGTIFTTTKIERYKNMLLGWAGDEPASIRLKYWWVGLEADPSKFPYEAIKDEHATMIVVQHGHNSQPYVRQYTSGPHATVITSPFTAWGSGRDLAISAMHCGKSAEEAVIVASFYNVYCGNGVDTLIL